jgi:hypothetical protein
MRSDEKAPAMAKLSTLFRQVNYPRENFANPIFFILIAAGLHHAFLLGGLGSGRIPRLYEDGSDR